MDVTTGSSYEYYKKSSVHGVKWTGSVEIITRIFNFIITLVLARLLTPHEFGLIALALVGVKFIQLVVDFGVSSAIVQKPQISKQHYNTTFTVITFASFFISLVFIFQSEKVASLIGNSDIASLLQLLSLVIILNGLNVVPRAYLIRELNFKKIAIAEFLSVVNYGIVTVITAFLLRSVWCFVFGLIAEQLSLMLVLWRFSHFKPRLNVNWGCMKDLYYFSSIVFGTGMMNFFNLNIFQILINKFYGSVSLGLFSLAFTIIDLPTQRIAKNFMKVMYPILSKLHQNRHDYEKIFINYMVIIVLIILPFYILLYHLSEPLILIFYGARWSGAIPLIRILCLVGLIRSLWTGISVASMSLGKPQFELFLNLLFASFIFPGIFFFSDKGLEVVLLLYAVLLLLVFILGFGKVLGWLEVSFIKTMGILRLPLVTNLILFAFIFLITKLVLNDNHHIGLLNFILISGSSIVLYVFVLYILNHKFYKDLIRLILK